MRDILDEYLDARRKYFMLRNDLVTMLTPNIIAREGAFPQLIRDVMDWDEEIKVLVMDFEFKNPRTISIPLTEAREAIR